MPNWKKLKHLSLDEARVRGSQKLAALVERRGLSQLARLPSDERLWNLTGRRFSSAHEILKHFRSRSEPKFFPGLEHKDNLVEKLRTRWPRAEQEILDRANRIVEGNFDLLGYCNLNFGNPIDWHLEPVSAKRTPLNHWSQLNYLDAELAGDKKIIWELNRHQFFVTLGQAYLLTGDERYARTFVAHLESWMAQNLPKLGINWASSLEVAFRSISWLWGFYFFKDSASLTEKTFARALKFLYLNARHLETYLSTYFSPNTHLTGEALGLYYLGLMLPEFKEAARWKQTGKQILLEQLPIHVRPDGVYFEQSSYYHRYTTDFYIHFLILSRANNDSVQNHVESRLFALLDHLMYITRPDGTTPLFGDDDGGRLMPLDRGAPNDFRATLATGSALFGRPDYKFVAAEVIEEALWLLGPSGLEILDRLVAEKPAKQSVAFDSGGYYVMRDGWTTKSNYLLFDCGPHGQGNCGHAHSDALSFDLASNGRTLLVDPGTFTYTGRKDLRDWFRDSQAHNTLTIDQRSASIADGPFSWESIAKCKRLAWIPGNRFDYVSGAHDGYEALTQPAVHERSIFFLKQDYWVICDHLKSAGAPAVDLWFHFDLGTNPLMEASPQEPAFIAENNNQTGLDVHSFGENGRWRRGDGWVSHCYGQKDPSRVYVFSATLGGARNAFTLLLPQTAESRWLVREIEAIGGEAFELANEKWLDIVMIRAADRVETARIASDFEWTWVRFPRKDPKLPEEFVLIGGQSLEVDGKEVLKSSRHLRHLTARRLSDDQFRIETDEGASSLSFPASERVSNRQ